MNENESLPILYREAVRVILLDARGRTLLFRGDSYWFTPGGGLDAGEDLATAARREVREEAGLEISELGPPLREEDIEFTCEGQLIRQHQTYFRVCIQSHEVSTEGWTELEVRTMTAHRWWTRAELENTLERFYPEDLISLTYLKKA